MDSTNNSSSSFSSYQVGQEVELLNHLCETLQISHWGWTDLTTPFSIDFYQSWLEEKRHADMDYLEKQFEDKKNPQRLGQNLSTALVFAAPYAPHPHPWSDSQKTNLKIASYAKGEDYHFWFQKKLNTLIEELKRLHPQEEFIAFTDSKPVLERDLARRAGLGWIGKNTCLIHPQHGSFFLIGEIYTSLKGETKNELVHDFCGHCNRCMVACPTQALIEPRKLDANKCISYWTIESQDLPPTSLRSQFSSWFFGCDICQEVCPWNEKVFKKTLHLKTSSQVYTETDPQKKIESLREILTSSYKQLLRKFDQTPLTRSRGFGLKRNALLVIGHEKIKELRPEVETLLENERLKDLAIWCLESLQE